MNWFDLVLVFGLVSWAVIGFRVGLIKAVLTLAGLALGVILAGQFYLPVSRWLGFIPNPQVAKAVAFVIIVLLVTVIAGILAEFLKQTAKVFLLGWLDSFAGAIFGLVFGAILWSAFLVAWLKFIGPAQPIVGSGIANFLLGIFPVILGFLPSEFDQIRNFFL